MTSQLDCHPASAEETLAAHRNVFDVWPMDQDPEVHLQKRVASPKSQRANYFVGTVDGVVATSLQSFPTTFQVRGELVPGIQIGSVHTHADFRKLGYAELLIEFTEQYEAERGVKLSALYCDIAVKYYEKMGYVLAPSKAGWFKTVEWSDERLANVTPLEDLNPRIDLTSLMQLHQETIFKRPIGVVRDEVYWDYTLRKFPNDRFWGLKDSSGNLEGYLRVGIAESRGQIVDWICRDDNPEKIQQLLTAFVKTAKAQSLSEVGGWLPDLAEVEELTSLSDRPKQITMFKSLSDELSLDDDLLQTANYFALIDHV
ncbi:MAG: GNAT family N-acetyltransferase [Planctomycetaceae bacterium]